VHFKIRTSSALTLKGFECEKTTQPKTKRTPPTQNKPPARKRKPGGVGRKRKPGGGGGSE
jgi:hypothetical protein